MASHGGARNRSGPVKDPESERSQRAGYTLQTLPAEGYKGPVPEFPLPDPLGRELEVWEWAWRTPQAAAWALPSEAWRQRTVALWVRTSVRAEDPDTPASVLAQLHRFADQVGLTTAGLAEMGWRVAVDETAEAREAKSPVSRSGSSRDRMKVVKSG